MEQLQIFNNPEFGNIRVIEIGGEPWMVGKDIAAALGYSDTFGALKKHVDDEDKQNCQNDSFETPRGMTVINESGLYSLVLSSKLPTAKQFKRWVTSEVLPSIRKHGLYATESTVEAMLNDPDTAIRLLQEIKEERAKRKALEEENEAQRQVIADFQPIRRYVDEILSSRETVTTAQIAADYDMTAQQLNKVLHEEDLQHKVGGQWILYRRHMGQGYTKSKTFPIAHKDGSSGAKMHTYWTQKGRMLINDILNKNGFFATMDKI